MKMIKIKKKFVLLTVCTICIVISLTYAIFLYQGLQFSVGRSGIDANVRVFLQKVSKISSNRNVLVSELEKYSTHNYENADYNFSIHDGEIDCFNIDELCIKAMSVPTYRGKHDVFIIGLKNGQIHQVENMGPDNIWDWLLGK